MNYLLQFSMLIAVLVYCAFIVDVENYNAEVQAFIDAMNKHFRGF